MEEGVTGSGQHHLVAITMATKNLTGAHAQPFQHSALGHEQLEPEAEMLLANKCVTDAKTTLLGEHSLGQQEPTLLAQQDECKYQIVD